MHGEVKLLHRIGFYKSVPLMLPDLGLNLERGARLFLRGRLNIHMRAAQFLQTAADRCECQLGSIAIAAEMAEVKLAQFRGQNFLENIGRRVVGEMAVPAENSLFDAPGPARVVL